MIKQIKNQLGKLIVGKIQGYDLSVEETEALASGKLGGITLFKENAKNLKQLIELICSIKKHSLYKLLISVDQEGGAVQRFDNVLSPLPSAMATAACSDLKLSGTINQINASELTSIGVNCLLAPVLDIPSNPANPIIGTRAYGTKQNQIIHLAESLIDSAKKSGIISVGKHFPGHGSTQEDSHTSLAVNKADADFLWKVELSPYRALIKKLPAILTGHIWVPSIDEESTPASLSDKITTGVLRNYLGFEGLVITDDLTMGAITERWGLGEAAVMAIEAGADMVLACGTINDTIKVHSALVKALESGRLSEERIQSSLNRIDGLLNSTTESKIDVNEVETKLIPKIQSNTQKSLDLLLSSITCLRGCIPDLNAGQWIILTPEHKRYSLKLAEYLKQELGNNFKLTEVRYSLNPVDNEVQKLAKQATGKNIIYLTFRAVLNKGQISLAAELAKLPGEKILCCLDTPYDILAFPTWDNCFATYDPSDLAMKALAIILAGNKKPTGICPVGLEFEIPVKF